MELVSNRRSLLGARLLLMVCEHKAEDMSNTMIKSGRNAAGLSLSDGSTKRFYTNASESITC